MRMGKTTVRRIETYLEEGKTIKKKIIESPWMRTDDAAAYCGISRTAFRKRAYRLPHGGDESLRLYHVSMLDAFIEGRLPDYPFREEEPSPPRYIRRMRSGLNGIIDPVTGKFYPAGGKTSL